MSTSKSVRQAYARCLQILLLLYRASGGVAVMGGSPFSSVHASIIVESMMIDVYSSHRRLSM